MLSPFEKSLASSALFSGPCCRSIQPDLCVLAPFADSERFLMKRDQHFIAAPTQGSNLTESPVRIEPVRAELVFREPVNGRELSDHWGYEVHYRISW